MARELTLTCVSDIEKPEVDIVFVHGLTGDSHETWSTELDGIFWPSWLTEELHAVSVYTLGYPASLLEKWANREMDMFERAGNVLEQLAGLGIGKRPIVFVAHSLGGILVKLVLRKSSESSDTDWQQVVDATKLVVFISTPHIGENLAAIARLIPGTSSHVELLANKFGFLEDLNLYYRSLTSERDDIATAVYYEKHTTNGIVVVPRASADPGISKVEPVPIDKNHINICKLRNRDDTIYLGLKRHIQRVTPIPTENAQGEVAWSEDFSERSIRDRRDLLQKLIDAGREYEYDYANDYQNHFARKYTKTGLLAAAREDHEILLSEIETRFVTHIYHPLICQSAEESEVREALQEKVIDPIVARNIGNSRFSPKWVLSGLYYLTEQCHIRWDKP